MVILRSFGHHLDYIKLQFFNDMLIMFFGDLSRAGYIMAYLNDLIIVKNSVDEAIERLKIVLKIAKDYGLAWKCQTLKESIRLSQISC